MIILETNHSCYYLISFWAAGKALTGNKIDFCHPIQSVSRMGGCHHKDISSEVSYRRDIIMRDEDIRSIVRRNSDACR